MASLYDLARTRPRKARNTMMDYSDPANYGQPDPAAAKAGTTMSAQPVSTVGQTVAAPATSTVGAPVTGGVKAANVQGFGGNAAPATGGLDPNAAAQFAGGQFGGNAAPVAAPAAAAPAPYIDPVSGGAGNDARRMADAQARDAARTAAHDRSPEAMAARQERQLSALAANPGLQPASSQAWQGNVGPNQYIDANGQLQYGYGINDPRNGGAPLYDDPRNGITGTLGANPNFDYKNTSYLGGQSAQYRDTQAKARNILGSSFLMTPDGKPDWATMGTAAFFNSLPEATRRAYVDAQLGAAFHGLSGTGGAR